MMMISRADRRAIACEAAEVAWRRSGGPSAFGFADAAPALDRVDAMLTAHPDLVAADLHARLCPGDYAHTARAYRVALTVFCATWRSLNFPQLRVAAS